MYHAVGGGRHGPEADGVAAVTGPAGVAAGENGLGDQGAAAGARRGAGEDLAGAGRRAAREDDRGAYERADRARPQDIGDRGARGERLPPDGDAPGAQSRTRRS